MVLSGPLTLHRRQPCLWMQALGLGYSTVLAKRAGDPIFRTGSRPQPDAGSPESLTRSPITTVSVTEVKIQAGIVRLQACMVGEVKVLVRYALSGL